MDLRELVKDYRNNFVGKLCQVSTNYKELSRFIVSFQATDLHHLFGFHKITNDYASQTLESIEGGLFDLEKFKNSPNYKDVKDRINLYPFISSVFLENATEYCVVRKDLSSNTMNLDLVFFEGKKRHVTVLGLRRSKTGEYKLVTLHTSLASKYARVRKTRITGITWL